MHWVTGIVICFQQIKRFFYFSKALRLALVPTQPPLCWVVKALSQGVKGLQCEAHHLPLSAWCRLSYVKAVLQVMNK